MANHRYKLEADGVLRGRDGKAIGRLVSMTLDIFDEEQQSGDQGVPTSTSEPSPAAQPSLEGLAAEEGGPGGTSGQRYDPVADVWQHYVAVMKPRDSGLSAEARKLIRDALKIATVDEIKRAINGCASSEFHMGKNDRRRKYNKLAQIIKARRGHNETTRDRIDFFLDLAEKSGVQSGVPSGDPARLSQAKRDVLDAKDFPSDEHVVARGREAEDYLRQHGVIFDSDNRRFLTSGEHDA